ncbi:hypothetical protein [Corynebacterium camporealensis]
MATPKTISYLLSRAQAKQPKLVSKAVTKALSSSGKPKKKDFSGVGCGIDAAMKAAGVPELKHSGEGELRPSGVRAANLAARIPGAK